MAEGWAEAVTVEEEAAAGLAAVGWAAAGLVVDLAAVEEAVEKAAVAQERFGSSRTRGCHLCFHLKRCCTS